MKNLLITGFEPFGGEIINPSWEAVSRLPSKIGEYRLHKLLVPVVFGEAAKIVINEAENVKPDVILCIGQAGGRDSITPELVAINLCHAQIPDNAGNQPKDEPIIVGGENALFSTLPVRKMAEALNAMGISSKLSYSAGAYVCNDLLYTLLAYYKDSETRVAFVHMPYCIEQGKEPSMTMENIVKGISVLIDNI